MNGKEEDINDIFCTIACSEVNINKKGFEEGYEIGKDIGWKEGQHLGYHKGAEVGSQIGYYVGFIDYLMKAEDKIQDKELFNKARPTIQKLKRLTEEFPKTNDHSVDIVSIFEQCRNVYKKLCALLKIQFDLPEAKFITY